MPDSKPISGTYSGYDTATPDITNSTSSSRAWSFPAAKISITELLKNRLAQGDIKSREDVLRILKEEGLHISRTGKDYIGVVVPESGLKIRLKGGIFSEAWKPKEQSSEDEVRSVKLELPKRPPETKWEEKKNVPAYFTPDKPDSEL